MAFEYIQFRCFRGDDCDTDYYLTVAEVREGVPVTKQATQKFDIKRCNLRKLSELEVKKQYQITMSYRFAALENLNDRKEINRFWENIKENIKISES